jgi:hypothetical protein
MTPPTSERGALLAKIGAFLQPAQVIGFMLSWFSMREAMSLGAAAVPEGGVVIKDVTADASHAFDYFLFGIGIAVVGLIFVIIAATWFRYRASWFFWFMCIYGGAMIMSYMAPFGLFLVIYALMKKREFPLDPPPTPGTMV